MATLHVLQGPDKGRTYDTADEPKVLIGRTAEQVQLSDDSVSRLHAELRPENGVWVLADLNSSNGTFLNGQRVVTPTPLKHGDQIRVGSSLLVFTGPETTIPQAERVRDLVDLELGSAGMDSSILAAVGAAEESVIIQPPEAADAVAAWNVVYKLAEMMGSIDSVEAFLERVADVIVQHIMVDRLVILMYDATSEKLTPQVIRFRLPTRGERPKIVTSRKIINHVLETKNGVLCANAMTDTRFGMESSQDSVHRLGLRSVVCVPIVAHGEVVGVCHLDCSMSNHTYTQEQLRLAVALGRLTGMAIENARLQQSRMRTERLAATGETVAYLSHHIRNILQGLQSGAEVIELGLKRSALDTVASGWDIVRRNLDRTIFLTMNMLTFSRERGPKIETIQLNKIVQDVLELTQRAADERNVVLLPDLGEIPAIPLDAEGIHQVVHNIVRNALEAVPEGEGRVNVKTAYDLPGGRVVVSISDNGPGIAPEELDHVFEAFHSSKGHAGTGLGLAAAHKVVKELKGSIEVESKVGEGTTFHVRLPAIHIRLADSDDTHGPGRW